MTLTTHVLVVKADISRIPVSLTFFLSRCLPIFLAGGSDGCVIKDRMSVGGKKSVTDVDVGDGGGGRSILCFSHTIYSYLHLAEKCQSRVGEN